MSSLRLYTLEIDALIEKLISACYKINANLQDILIALKDNSIQ